MPSFGNQKITDLANGTALTDAINKSQLDNAVGIPSGLLAFGNSGGNGITSNPRLSISGDNLNWGGADNPTINLNATAFGYYPKIAFNALNQTGAYIQYFGAQGFQYNALSGHYHSFLFGGTEGVRFTSAGIKTVVGSAANPSISFLGTNTGFSTDGTNLITSVNSNRVWYTTPKGRLLNDYPNNILINGGNETAQMAVNVVLGSSLTALTSYSYYNTIIGNNNLPIATQASGQTVIGINNLLKGTNLWGYLGVFGNDNLASIRNTPNYVTIGGHNNINNASELSSTNILGSTNFTRAIRVINSVIVGNVNNYNAFVPDTNSTYSIAAVSGNVITISPALPANYIGGVLYMRGGTGLPTPLTQGSDYSFNVLSTTTIQSQTALTNAATGGQLIRGYDDVSNVVVLGDGLTIKENNSINIGNGTAQVFNLKNGIYKFNLQSASLGISNDKQGFFYNVVTGQFELSTVQNYYNANGSLTGERTLTVGSYNTYWNGAGAFVLGQPSTGGKLAIANYQAGRTALWAEGVAAKFAVDWVGDGSILLTGTSKFSTYAGVNIVEVNSNGLTLLSGKKITGLPTSGATGSDAISVSQADNDLGTECINSLPSTGSAITIVLSNKKIQYYRWDLTARSSSVTISVSNMKAGCIYIFSAFNKATNYNFFFDNAQFKANDLSNVTQVNTTTIAFSRKFISDGTYLIEF
jgi:hypothetical protein